jgi:hypothetical protein
VGGVAVLEEAVLPEVALEEEAAEAGNPMNFGFHKAWKKRNRTRINRPENPLII